MKTAFIILVLYMIGFSAQAQQAEPVYQNYGKVDMADLQLKDCDFEKGANAEILFDKGVIERGFLNRHVRIKIFTEAGLGNANINLKYNSFGADIGDFKAETINLTDGKIVITPVNKKLVYTQKLDNFNSTLTFAFPDVRPGSIVEFKYSVESGPAWFFQNNIPTRYNEIEVSFPGDNEFKYIPHISHPFVKNVGESYSLYQDKVLTNIHSLPDEPYMGGRKDNLERMEYVGIYSRVQSWQKIGELLAQYDGFGGQFGGSLTGEDEILQQAKGLTSRDEKISFIYNQVKNNMKWNDVTTFATNDGTARAWDRKTGNSAEINLILYHLLNKAKIDAYPMITSTKDNGKINPFNPDPYSFNNAVVFIPADTAHGYPKDFVLDATDKFNLFNKIPKDDLNTFGLVIDKKKNVYKMAFMQDEDPVIQSVYLNVEIKPEGKMVGTAEISSTAYNKMADVAKYKTDGEEKFIKYITDNNNSLKVLSLQMQNMDVDTLPLVKDINFSLDLAAADENYIYFTPNLFITPNKNPFLSETRLSDVDFAYHDEILINGSFKLPSGYKVDAMPKSEILTMPDNTITFKRVVNQDDDAILLRYTIIYKKTLYSKDDYPYLRDFYKKMYEMLNEPIVLKKP